MRVVASQNCLGLDIACINVKEIVEQIALTPNKVP